jgi:hypothetical protein
LKLGSSADAAATLFLGSFASAYRVDDELLVAHHARIDRRHGFRRTGEPIARHGRRKTARWLPR